MRRRLKLDKGEGGSIGELLWKGEGVKLTLVFCVAILLAGCAQELHYETIHIISDPPGARIEVDDEYVGDAPVDIQVLANSTGTFARSHTEIRALPVYSGQQTQLKIFHGGVYDPYYGPDIYSDKIPKTILFDMDLRQVPRP